MSTDWHLKMRATLNAFTGKIVTDAWVNEMAFYGAEHPAHFTDPNLPFAQANILELGTSEGDAFHFCTWQDDDEWALWPRIASVEQFLCPDPGDGIFRTRLMSEFPTGSVANVRVQTETGENIHEICFEVDGQEVILRAGEVYENTDGTLTVGDRDESVLVFLDREAYSSLTFNKPICRRFFT